MPKKISLVDATKRKEQFVQGREEGSSGLFVHTARRTAVSTDGKKKATFNLDAALHKRLKVAAAQRGREMVELVEEALEGHLNKLEKPGLGGAGK